MGVRDQDVGGAKRRRGAGEEIREDLLNLIDKVN
jgi:hypothetical protein